MTLDRSIHDVLDQQAGTVETPWPPPVQGLLDAGRSEVRRRRTRNRLVGASAIAAALLVVVPAGLLLAGGPGGPDRARVQDPVARTDLLALRQLPLGAPPSTLYCVDGVVHWQGTQLPLSDGTCEWPHRIAEAGGYAVVADWGRSTIALFSEHGGSRLPAHVDTESSPIAMSPDGLLAAWVSRDRTHGREEVVLADTRQGVELKRVPAPTADMLNLEGIDATGHVYMTSVGGHAELADHVWVWPTRRDEGFLPVSGLGDFVTLADVRPHGLVVLKTDDPLTRGHAVGGTVTEGGRFVPEWDADVRPAVWSPDRTRFLRVGARGVTVRTTAGAEGARVALRLPSDVSVVGTPSWESPDEVLVPVEPADGRGVALLRCSATNGRCEVAAVGAHGIRLPNDDANNMG